MKIPNIWKNADPYGFAPNTLRIMTIAGIFVGLFLGVLLANNTNWAWAAGFTIVLLLLIAEAVANWEKDKA